jgi:hypothetical protein
MSDSSGQTGVLLSNLTERTEALIPSEAGWREKGTG